MRAIFIVNSGSRLAFQVLVACQLIPALRRTWRTVSVLTTIRCALARCSTSLARLHVVNGSPNCCGEVLATRQTISRATDPNLRGRPPLHFGSSAASPCWLNAWITSRAYCAVAANIAAASAGLRPCIEASTIPARRNRTRSRAVLAILTRRCASAGSNSRTNTSGCRAITTSADSLPGPETVDQADTITTPTFLDVALTRALGPPNKTGLPTLLHSRRPCPGRSHRKPPTPRFTSSDEVDGTGGAVVFHTGRRTPSNRSTPGSAGRSTLAGTSPTSRPP